MTILMDRIGDHATYMYLWLTPRVKGRSTVVPTELVKRWTREQIITRYGSLPTLQRVRVKSPFYSGQSGVDYDHP